MRKAALFICVVFLPIFAGCTVSDALFGVFGDHYTGGGYTQAEKKEHYDQQVRASQNYESLNP